VSYPGTYAHGGFNRETTIMAGVPVLNEDLVNLPNWLLLELRIEGEEALGMDNVEVLSYRHEASGLPSPTSIPREAATRSTASWVPTSSTRSTRTRRRRA
jgi:glycosyl hydrolase family 65